MRKIVVEMPDELHPDSVALVQRFAEALAFKLTAAQKKYGYTNEWTKTQPYWNAVTIQRSLLYHIDKGDPKDVAIYASFLWWHGWPTAFPQGWSLGYTPGFKPGTYTIGCEDDCEPD